MLILFIRTIILYITVVIIMRLMGKRQIGQLQPFEFVITLMISELASVPMEEIGIPLISGLIPLFTLLFLQVTLSFILIKSERARNVICGTPSIIISDGKINEKELLKLQYSTNDLLEQLRNKDCFNILDVKYGILETNGELSIMLNNNVSPVTKKDMNINDTHSNIPLSLIVDGKIDKNNLNKTKYTKLTLAAEFKKYNIFNLNDVFYCTLDENGKLNYQLKDKG